MMAKEYKNRGGEYNTPKKDQDESQKHLSKWGEEDWQTKDGGANAKQQNGTQKRYLPKRAWEEMSEGEKERTDKQKQEGSKQGKQYVGNTPRAKEARKHANEDEDAKFEEKKQKEKSQNQETRRETRSQSQRKKGPTISDESKANLKEQPPQKSGQKRKGSHAETSNGKAEAAGNKTDSKKRKSREQDTG